MYIFVGIRCDEVHLGIADLADCHIVTAAKQLEVNDVLDGVPAVPMAKASR